jgi:hypothetical protein
MPKACTPGLRKAGGTLRHRHRSREIANALQDLRRQQQRIDIVTGIGQPALIDSREQLSDDPKRIPLVEGLMAQRVKVITAQQLPRHTSR